MTVKYTHLAFELMFLADMVLQMRHFAFNTIQDGHDAAPIQQAHLAVTHSR